MSDLPAIEPGERKYHLICAYLNESCRGCPAKVMTEHYGPAEVGCYGIAKELYNIAHLGGPFDTPEANERWAQRHKIGKVPQP